MRRCKARCGSTVYIPNRGYHVPAADICLESPQSVIGALGGGGHAIIRGYNIEWHLHGGRIIDIPVDPKTNLPQVDDFVCSSAEKGTFAKYSDNIFMGLGMCMLCEKEPPDLKNQDKTEKAHHCCKLVTDVANQNIGGAQKELSFWHQKLCINMIDLQLLMKSQSAKDQEGNVIFKRTVIPTKYKSTSNLKREDFPLCLACKLATTKGTSADVIASKTVKNK